MQTPGTKADVAIGPTLPESAFSREFWPGPCTDFFSTLLDIHKGGFLGIIGPTGAGKSTLLLTLSGIVPQFFGGRFFGAVTVAGMDTLEHPVSHLARHVGVVFEDPETQLVMASVKNEVAFAMENFCVPVDEIRRRIPQVLEAVRLEGFEDKHPQELSGGQKQRLAIAAAWPTGRTCWCWTNPLPSLIPSVPARYSQWCAS